MQPSKVCAALGFSLPQPLYQQDAAHVSTEALLDLESATEADETEIDTTETPLNTSIAAEIRRKMTILCRRSYHTWTVRLGKNARAKPSGACGPVGGFLAVL